jgi:hypothetical protein
MTLFIGSIVGTGLVSMTGFYPGYVSLGEGSVELGWYMHTHPNPNFQQAFEDWSATVAIVFTSAFIPWWFVP